MSSALSDLFSLVGGRLDGKYDVHSVIGEGGFAVVYRGTHRHLEKPVAIKVLKTPATLPEAARGEFLQKFVFEAKTLARLEHPAIVRVLDFGAGLLPAGGAAPWIVLEWIDGESLEDRLSARRGHGGAPPAEALALLRPVFAALAVAHDEGFAHRDLKPANVMLARTRGGIEPKLLDFGIAKSMEREVAEPSGHSATHSSLRAFTLAYASPEQLGGTRTGPWTDVHALALLMVEVLTDLAPIAGEDATALTAAVMSPTRPTPGILGLDVGPWEAVLRRALAMRPGERFQDARAFLQALEAEVPEGATWRASHAHLAGATTVDVPGATTPLLVERVSDDAVTTLRPTAAPPPATTPTFPSHARWIAAGIVVVGLVAAAALLPGTVVRRSTVPMPPIPMRAAVAPPPGEPSGPVPLVAREVPLPPATLSATSVDAGALSHRTAPSAPPRAAHAPTRPPVPTRRVMRERVPVD